MHMTEGVAIMCSFQSISVFVFFLFIDMNLKKNDADIFRKYYKIFNNQVRYGF